MTYAPTAISPDWCTSLANQVKALASSSEIAFSNVIKKAPDYPRLVYPQMSTSAWRTMQAAAIRAPTSLGDTAVPAQTRNSRSAPITTRVKVRVHTLCSWLVVELWHASVNRGTYCISFTLEKGNGRFCRTEWLINEFWPPKMKSLR